MWIEFQRETSPLRPKPLSEPRDKISRAHGYRQKGGWRYGAQQRIGTGPTSRQNRPFRSWSGTFYLVGGERETRNRSAYFVGDAIERAGEEDRPRGFSGPTAKPNAWSGTIGGCIKKRMSPDSIRF